MYVCEWFWRVAVKVSATEGLLVRKKKHRQDARRDFFWTNMELANYPCADSNGLLYFFFFFFTYLDTYSLQSVCCIEQYCHVRWRNIKVVHKSASVCLNPFWNNFCSFPSTIDHWIVWFTSTHLQPCMSDSLCRNSELFLSFWKAHFWQSPPATSLQVLQGISSM